MAVSKLQRVCISKLHLTVSLFPVAAQRVWRTYSQCDHFHLELSRHYDVETHVHALPLCKDLTLTDARFKRSGVPTGSQTLVIQWQTLARPGRLHVWPHAELGVQIRGVSYPLPDSFAPWQLLVHNNAGITGLPPSRPVCAPATYFLQIAAADLAGWTAASPG